MFKGLLIVALIAELVARLFGFQLWPCPAVTDGGECFLVLHNGSSIATLQGSLVVTTVAVGVFLFHLYRILR